MATRSSFGAMFGAPGMWGASTQKGGGGTGVNPTTTTTGYVGGPAPSPRPVPNALLALVFFEAALLIVFRRAFKNSHGG
jgi:hypothetical protein